VRMHSQLGQTAHVHDRNCIKLGVYDEVYFVIEIEYSIQYIKSIYKMRKRRK